MSKRSARERRALAEGHVPTSVLRLVGDLVGAVAAEELERKAAARAHRARAAAVRPAPRPRHVTQRCIGRRRGMRPVLQI